MDYFECYNSLVDLVVMILLKFSTISKETTNIKSLNRNSKYILYLLNKTTTVILELKIYRRFGLEISIGHGTGLRFQFGGGHFRFYRLLVRVCNTKYLGENPTLDSEPN